MHSTTEEQVAEAENRLRTAILSSDVELPSELLNAVVKPDAPTTRDLQ